MGFFKKNKDGFLEEKNPGDKEVCDNIYAYATSLSPPSSLP